MVVDGIHYSLPGSAGAPGCSRRTDRLHDLLVGFGLGRVDVTPDAVHVRFMPMTGKPLLDYTVR